MRYLLHPKLIQTDCGKCRRNLDCATSLLLYFAAFTMNACACLSCFAAWSIICLKFICLIASQSTFYGFQLLLSCFDHISVPSTPEIHKPGAYSTNLRFQSQPSHRRFPSVWWCMFRWFESQFVTWHVDSKLLHYRLSTTTSEQGQAYILYYLHIYVFTILYTYLFLGNLWGPQLTLTLNVLCLREDL